MEQRLIDSNKIEYENIYIYPTDNRNYKECVGKSAKIREADTVFTIPENPTNGDMIRALFPNCEWFIIESLQSVNVTTDPSLSTQTFDIYWWNAPYRKEG
jgi:hypothetical protein